MLANSQKLPPLQAFERLRLAALAVLALAAVMCFSEPSRAAVFGRDDRRVLTAADDALQDKIGTLVSSQNGAFCTAFCLAPDVIATASHCLFGTAATSRPNIKDFRFTTARSGPLSPVNAGTPLAARRSAALSQTVISGTTRLSVAPPIGAYQDWAVARLESPVCQAGGLPLSPRTPGELIQSSMAGALYQVAVHADLVSSKLHRGAPCAVNSAFPDADAATIARDFANPDAIVFHTCDTGGGSSGSPLLIDGPHGPEVVAINVGTYVLSKAVTTSNTAADQSKASPSSEPIANTAIAIEAIKNALTELNARRRSDRW